RDKIHSELLPDSVNQKLEEWFLSGRIEDMINNDVFNEYLARIEDVENRVENKELLQEVNIKDYAELVEGGNWYPAIMQALEDAYTVYFPIGEYTTYGIVSNLSNRDRKSTRLNSSHVSISYAVFCLKKKINITKTCIS